MRLKPKLYDILMDVKRGLLNNEIIKVITGDFGMNRFNLKLLEDRLASYNLQNAIVRIMVVTPSGSKQQQDLIVENAIGGSANITLKQSLFSESGEYLAEFQIFDETTQVLRLTTPRFKYFAVESLQDDETITASDEYSMLQSMIETVGDIESIREQSNENTEQLSKRIKKDGDNITGVYTHNFITHRGLIWATPATITQGIKIKTKITPGNTSLYATIELKGYSYDYTAPAMFDHSIGFRNWSPFAGTGIISKNGVTKPEIKIAVEDGFVVIFVNIQTTAATQFTVDARFNADTDNYSGWTWEDKPLKESATNVKIVAYL